MNIRLIAPYIHLLQSCAICLWMHTPSNAQSYPMAENCAVLNDNFSIENMSFDEFDSLLEAGFLSEISNDFITEDFKGSQSKAVDRLVLSVTRNWTSRPELLEPAIRYSQSLSCRYDNDRNIMHALAENCSMDIGKSSRSNPILHFVDMYLLAINGCAINKTDVNGVSPFEVFCKRAIVADLPVFEIDTRITMALAKFYRLSSSNDPFLKQFTAEGVQFFSGSSLNRMFVESVRRSNFSAFPESLLSLNPDKYVGSLGLSCNRWFLEIHYKDPTQNAFSQLFRIQNINLSEYRNKFLPYLDNKIAWLNDSSEESIGLLFQAYASNDLQTLEKMMAIGASPDDVLDVCLYDYIFSRDTSMVSPAFSPRKGDTILLAASLDPFRKITFIPSVLKYTKKPDARDLLNRNALHRFLYHRVLEDQKFLLKLLLDAGVDVNAKSVSSNTPCHVATYRNARLIPQMVDAGADLYAKNDRGETPVDLLKRSLDEKWIFHEENQAVLDQLKSQGRIKE